MHGLDARGKVVAADYARAFAPLVDRVQEAGERLRLLFWFGPSFERITLGALWADSRLGNRYISVMDGCALVTDIDWVREPARGIARWLPCPMRVYDNAHRDDAVQWLARLPPATNPRRPKRQPRIWAAPQAQPGISRSCSQLTDSDAEIRETVAAISPQHAGQGICTNQIRRVTGNCCIFLIMLLRNVFYISNRDAHNSLTLINCGANSLAEANRE